MIRCLPRGIGARTVDAVCVDNTGRSHHLQVAPANIEKLTHVTCSQKKCLQWSLSPCWRMHARAHVQKNAFKTSNLTWKQEWEQSLDLWLHCVGCGDLDLRTLALVVHYSGCIRHELFGQLVSSLVDVEHPCPLPSTSPCVPLDPLTQGTLTMAACKGVQGSTDPGWGVAVCDNPFPSSAPWYCSTAKPLGEPSLYWG